MTLKSIDKKRIDYCYNFSLLFKNHRYEITI